MAEKEMAEPDIIPVSAKDVEASQPPPSYQEVMGQFLTSVAEEQVETPPLSYIDIMPRMVSPGNMKNKIAPTFEKFSDIVEGANVWLKKNPGLRVWKCETVERKVERGPLIQLDHTLFHESSFGANYYVFGLRLWLTRRSEAQEPLQELGLVNVPPPVKEIPVTMAVSGRGMLGMGGMLGGVGAMPMYPVMHFGRRRRVTMLAQGMWQTYEGLSKAVDSFNEAMHEEPLQGSILNVETASVKFGDNFTSKEADPDVTSWSEKGSGPGSSRRFTKILRVFYVKGPPRHETLKMVVHLPAVVRQPEWNKPAQFETFDEVVSSAQQWLQTLSGERVVSIETRDTEFHAGYGQPGCFAEDSTDEFIFAFKDRNLVRYLRVFYVNSPDASSEATVMTSRLFVPASLGGRRFESMTQTMHVVNAWLSAVGQPIFSVETVPFLLTAGNRVETSRLNYRHNSRVGNYWLTCIRLYFPAPFQEPPSEMLPGSSSQSSSCSIL